MFFSKKKFVIFIVLFFIAFILYKTIPASSTKPTTIVLIGDSMTEKLGDNVTELKDYLKKYYPNKEINILNYGFGSTNIESVPDRLQKDTERLNRVYPAVLSQNFDVIIIESFGNNPLSESPLNEGLKRQTAALDRIIELIRANHPKSKIIFEATIAPHKDRYGEGVVVLDTKVREEWAVERAEYIKNHIKYALNHKIPLINIYQDSLDGSGGGNIDYINTSDFIHPSTTGVYFISQKIADFLYKNRLL